MESSESVTANSDYLSHSNPLWNHVVVLGKSEGQIKGGNVKIKGGNVRFKCKFCNMEFSGSFSRVKSHLLKIGQVGIRKCSEVTAEILSQLQGEVDEFEKANQTQVPFASSQARSASFSGGIERRRSGTRMASSDKKLEQQLMKAGKKLLAHPSSVDELLSLLDQIENCLSKVDQSPSKSMQNALVPSMKALVADQLSKHSDVDVKVAVATCINEISRITAPDAPYGDDQMKDVFQLIVSSFENLSDKSSRSYSKRTSILETVAKVRSCVVMLDLGCDGLIIDMFHHFLSAIRDYHPENVFKAMETIMAHVLDESDHISAELLSPFLETLKKGNEEVLPIACKLAEKVLENCANKVKPYLQHAVKSLGVSLDDYSDVIASICPASSIEQNDARAADENKAGKEIAAEAGSPSKKQDDCTHADQSKGVDTPSSSNTDRPSKKRQRAMQSCSCETVSLPAAPQPRTAPVVPEDVILGWMTVPLSCTMRLINEHGQCYQRTIVPDTSYEPTYEPTNSTHIGRDQASTMAQLIEGLQACWLEENFKMMERFRAMLNSAKADAAHWKSQYDALCRDRQDNVDNGDN